jgi:hypothetical protein
LKPFSKPLRSVYRSQELNAMYQLLLEKGLRIRAELELGDWSSDVDVEMEANEEDEGDDVKPAEILFEDRKRLMPY